MMSASADGLLNYHMTSVSCSLDLEVDDDDDDAANQPEISLEVPAVRYSLILLDALEPLHVGMQLSCFWSGAEEKQ